MILCKTLSDDFLCAEFLFNKLHHHHHHYHPGYLRVGNETIEMAVARHDTYISRLKKTFDHDVIVDCNKMQEFTREDLDEMLFGTRQLILANAGPFLKVSMVTACIASGVPPIVSSHLGKCLELFSLRLYF